MTLLRRAAAALLVTALAGVGVAMAAVPAEAASSYRYWSYWYAGGSASSWTYGPIGPAGHTVVDGGVEGWRFIVAAPNPSAPPPRHQSSTAFKDVCGSTARPAGQVRVALVVDFGTPSDAPPHESPPASVVGTCVIVPEGSKGLKVLTDAGYSPRITGGLICGLSGYPAHECGVVVTAPPPTPTPKPSPSKPKPTKSAATPPTATRSPSAPSGSTGTCCASPTASAPSANGSPPSSSPSPTDSATPLPVATDGGDPALAVGPPPPPAGGSGGGTPAGLLLGGALVVGVGAAAVLRNRSQHHGERGTA